MKKKIDQFDNQKKRTAHKSFMLEKISGNKVKNRKLGKIIVNMHDKYRANFSVCRIPYA